MENYIVFGILGVVIVSVLVSSFRERAAEERISEAARLGTNTVILDPDARSPLVIASFDATREALLVQLPATLAAEVSSEDFATRATPGGHGQELLFRDRVFLRLPNVGPRQRLDIFIAPLEG